MNARTGKTGLQIVTDVIDALRNVVVAAETAKSRDDSKLAAARVKLGEAIGPAYVAERRKWINEVNHLVRATYNNWVETRTTEIVNFESSGSYGNWKIADVRAECLNLIEHLKQFEPNAHERAEAAKQEVLERLLG